MSQKSALRHLGWIPFAWYLVFLLGPLFLVMATGFAIRGTYGGIVWQFGLENFVRGFDPLYLRILFNSLGLSFVTVVLCAIIGLPLAFVIATRTERARSFYILLLAIPFLTNLVIRICALKSFTAYDGPLAQILTWLSVPFDPFALSQNTPLVVFGMVSSYLPFMVFPLYGALERFDFTLVEAAQDLGATYAQVFLKIIVPALWRALVAGTLLVFIPAMGEFLIPDLLGGAKVMLTGNLISEQFLKARDWPFGSALSVLLMALLMSFILVTRFFERKKAGDGE